MSRSAIPRDPKGWADRDLRFAAIRRACLGAIEEWRDAGGTWEVGEGPTHPTKFERIQEAERIRGEAASQAMPPDPSTLLAGVRGRDPKACTEAVAWLETDPFTWNTGYFKQKLMAALCGAQLVPKDEEKLRQVLLRITGRGPRMEFSVACRLARHVDSAQFRNALRRIVDEGDERTTYAARRMLRACETKGTRTSK